MYNGAMWNVHKMQSESHTTRSPCQFKQPVTVHGQKATVEQRLGASAEPNLLTDPGAEVTYTPVMDVHDSSSKSQKSLSAGAALIVRLAVTLPMLLNPATFGLSGTYGVMANAGYGTLCSELWVNMIEQDGNVGRALKAMEKKDIVLSVARSMATAGLTKELGDVIGVKSGFELGKNGKILERAFGDYAKAAVLNSAVNTMMSVVIDGQDVGDALRHGAVSAAINTAASWGAGKIGGMYIKAIDPVVHKALHAGLGAASGATAAAILGGDVRMAALSGATGAFIAETLADVMKPDEKTEVKSALDKKMSAKEFERSFMEKAQSTTKWANFAAAVAAFGMGQDVGVAYGAAHNATANNNVMCLAIAAAAIAENFAIYETVYALAAAGGLKALLDSLQVRSEADGTYKFNGINYATLQDVFKVMVALPLLMQQVVTIEFIKDLMDADAGKPQILTTPIHETGPIILVTPLPEPSKPVIEGYQPAPEDFDTGLVEGYSVPEGIDTGLLEGFAAYDGPVVTVFTKDGESPKLKAPISGISGKEGAKNVPSWVRGERPNVGESGKDFADRLLGAKYGIGNFSTGTRTEHNQIKKWGDRAFKDPK
jgi:hypothetical protein